MNRTAVVIVGKCALGRGLFGMRTEKTESSSWLITWSFPIDEVSAGRENYGDTEVTGAIAFATGIRCCPRCQADSFTRCGSCGKVTCWRSEVTTSTCQWCGDSGVVSGSITSLSVSRDVG